MSLPLQTIQRLAAAPYDASSTYTRFVVDTSDDNLSLGEGVYTLVNDGTVTAHCKLGGAAAQPSDKAALAAGFALTAGAALDLVLSETAALHAITASGSTALLILKRVP